MDMKPTLYYIATLLLTISSVSINRGEIPGRKDDDLWFTAWSYDVPGNEAYFKQLAKDFADSSNRVSIHIDLGTWNDAHSKIKNWIDCGQGLDLVVIPDIWLVEFAEGIEACWRSFTTYSHWTLS